jgi:acetolactate synthase-1/2/3 large subunit
MRLSGAGIIIEILREQGVDTVFGYPGSSVLKIYDELYKAKDSIRHILTSHEQGAAHAADGYARASGRTGVCIATSGPGATNLVTGIATAYMDSVPLLALTCNVDKKSLGKDSFQEVDINGITMPVTKHGYIIKDITELAPTLRRAFAITQEGRKGPVIVDITKNVLEDTAEFESVLKASDKSGLCGASEKSDCLCGASDKKGKNVLFDTVDPADLKTAKRLINTAKRPLILIGGGVVRSNAGTMCEALSKKLSAPMICSMMGKGAVNEFDPLFAGMTGREGNSAANRLLSECDTLICAGIRFSDRMTNGDPEYAKDKKIIQIDIDPAEINKNVRGDVSLCCDAKAGIKAVLEVLKENEHKTWIKKAAEYIENEKNENCRRTDTGSKVILKCLELTKGDAIVTTEVGQHQLLAATLYKTGKDGKFITSGGLGTMGYGLSAAIGAKLACPGKKVINFAGDGCFRMNMNELLSASRHNIPVVQVVFDNQVLGLVYNMQKDLYNSRFSATEFKDRLDFVKLAEALGVKALRITGEEDIGKVLKEALNSKEPVVVDCMIQA